MSENSPFPANQKFQPPINACPNTDYNHSFFLPQSTAGSTREGFEHPPQKRPRLSNPIQNSPQNFFPNTMMHPPNPMTRNPPPVNPSQNTKGIFFKTKLCTGFRQGRCTDANKCDYAHGMEELRKPPPGWQEMARNEQHTKPCRHIYKSLCSYGDACTFSHIDPPSYGGEVGLMQLRDQEVKQTGENSNKNLNAIGNQKSASYKTRLCHAYERNGTCRKGDQCQFAHGDAELRSYGGYNEVDTRSNVDATTLSNPCPAPASDATPTKTQPPACVLQQTEDEDHKTPYEWRGPTKLSLIYGDWIYDPS